MASAAALSGPLLTWNNFICTVIDSVHENGRRDQMVGMHLIDYINYNFQ